MTVRFPEIVSADAHVAASPPDHIALNVHVAGWPKDAKAYADPGSKCALAQCAAEGVLGNECALFSMM